MGGDVLIRRFRHRLAGFLFLRSLLFYLTCAAFLSGVAVLAVRVAAGTALPVQMSVAAAGLAVLVAICGSLVVTFRRLPSAAVLCAVFDKTNECGGLLMTASQTDIGGWSGRLSGLDAPRITWRGRRLGLTFLSALVFLGFSFMVPQRYITTRAAGRLEIADQTRRLAEQIQVLEEENIIAEETAHEMQQKVDRIEETAMGRDPVKTWEALGHLQDQLKKAAEEASVGMLAETEGLTQAEMLAQALDEMGMEMDEQAMKAAMSELARMTQLLMAQNEAMKNTIDGSLLESLNSGQLSPEQLKQLMEALQGQKGNLSEQMMRLCEADLAQMKLMEMCQAKGQGNAEGLKALLAESQGGQAAAEAVALYMNNPNWGVDRGRGDAPMVWSDPSSEQGSAFKEQILPPASLASLEDSQLAGVSVSAPSVEEGTENLQAGGLDAAQTGSGQAVKRTILPKHKAVVNEYFERGDDGN